MEKIKTFCPISTLAENMNIELVRVGDGRYRCFSIINDEKTPSMFLKDSDNRWKCFSSGKGGDTLDLICEYYKLDLFEAIQKYSQLTGFDLNPFKRELTIEEQIKEELYKSVAMAQQIFTNNLWSDVGTKALNYLRGRGFTDDIIKRYNFGYSPKAINGNTCVAFVQNADVLQLKKTDVFSDAITIPLTDEYGRIWSFQTKPFNHPFGAKYTSTNTEHPLYREVRMFGFYESKKLAREEQIDYICITEGCFDALALVQMGFPSFCVLGTNGLKKEVYSIIKNGKFGQVIFVLDGDNAGRKATLKYAKEFCTIKTGLNGKVVLLPNIDPNDFLNEYGKEEMENYIEDSMYCEEYVLDNIEYNSDYEYLTNGVEVLKSFESSVAKIYGIRYFSKKTGFDETAITDMLLSKQGETEPLVDTDSEEICLGELIRNEDFMYESNLSETDFYLFRHKQLFRVIKEVGNNIDNILSKSKDYKYDISREFLEYLNGRNYDEFALQNMLDKSSRRKALKVLQETIENINNLEESVDYSVENATDKLFKATHSKEDESIITSQRGCDSLLKQVEEARRNGTGLIGYSYGVNNKMLDAYTHGLAKSDTVVISATSSVGKSMWLSNMIADWCINQNLNVLLFSLEMPAEENLLRIACILGGLDCSKVVTGNMNEEEYKLFIQTLNRVKAMKLEIVTDKADLGSVLAIAKNRVKRGKADIVCIDYIQLLYSQNRRGSDNRTTELVHITRSLRNFALECKVPLIEVSQLGKQATDKLVVSMADVKDSYSISQDATHVFALRNKSDEEIAKTGIENGNKQYQILKNRRGQLNVFVNMYHEGATYRLTEV